MIFVIKLQNVKRPESESIKVGMPKRLLDAIMLGEGKRDRVTGASWIPANTPMMKLAIEGEAEEG